MSVGLAVPGVLLLVLAWLPGVLARPPFVAALAAVLVVAVGLGLGRPGWWLWPDLWHGCWYLLLQGRLEGVLLGHDHAGDLLKVAALAHLQA